MTFARRTILQLLGTAALIPSWAVAAQAEEHGSIDWAAFLGRHDLIWERLPKSWDESPFLGNGMMGAMLYQDAATGALRLDIGRCDVQDHRDPVTRTSFDTPRLPIGHFLLRTKGQLREACDLRLVLRDAMLTGEVETDRGRIALRAYVHATDSAIVVESRATGGEAGASWEWVGEQANSPRQTFSIVNKDPTWAMPGYRDNPPGALGTDGSDRLWLQPLLAGGGTATAWRATPTRLVVSVAHDFPGDGAKATALASLRAIAGDPAAKRRHLAWWHAYYPASFLSIPDTRIESFYWIQVYKLAAATRGDSVPIDCIGPWLQPTPWPAAWWNLNVQLSYWPTLTSNRAHLAGSLTRAIHDHQANLIANAAPQYRSDSATMSRTSGSELKSPAYPPGQAPEGRGSEVGNLTWALHNVWLVWRHTMDETLLRDTLFPVLRRAINYYRHFLTEGADGKLHLPPTYSPEYGTASDLNYDLSLLRWGCGALIDAAARLKIGDPLLPEWRRILSKLVDYPQDRTGYMIGAGMPFARSHRHYSHLLMAYPLYLVNREQPGASELIKRSVDH